MTTMTEEAGMVIRRRNGLRKALSVWYCVCSTSPAGDSKLFEVKEPETESVEAADFLLPKAT